ncbi:MAG TPA: DUF2130 domain-containing protein [Prolixibacteraceae bacterium]|nr:DUF2130 domain-containing protein [Prolixibacteraceae bacterium]
MQRESKIICPSCGFKMDVPNILLQQIEEGIRRNYQLKLIEEKQKLDALTKSLEIEKLAFEEKKRKENELFKERLNIRLKEEKKLIEIEIKEKIEKENSEQIKMLEKRLNDQSDKLKDLSRANAEIEKLKREKSELKEVIRSKYQKVLNQKLEEEKQKIRNDERNKNEMILRELQMKLEDQKKLTLEMKRKQDQGSIYIKGEVQELAIEEWLKSNFPLDNIVEIKKGFPGGDCIQYINTRTRKNCGSIYYESKRTKSFQSGWIEKFKSDICEKNINLGVIVTETMPANMQRMGLKDGIWICTYEEFKGLSFVLREALIMLNNTVALQENKAEKMEMLYSFFTSKAFAIQIDSVVETFSQMKNDLENEKRTVLLSWRKRDKQIEKVLTRTIDMYSSIKEIAGNELQTVKALESSGYDYENDSKARIYQYPEQ